LPLSYKVEQIPSNIDIKTKFGQFSTSLFYDLKEIRFVRQFKFFKGDYPILDYEEFVNFCQKIATYDERKAALERIF
jgi:hypothetical protein